MALVGAERGLTWARLTLLDPVEPVPGVARTENGNDAEIVLFASRLALAEGEGPAVFGRVRWIDPGFASRGVAVESVEVTSYGPQACQDESSPEREVRGTMSADGEGDHPFLLQLTLSEDEEGLGGDAISLTVGAGAAGTPATGGDDGDA